MTSSKKIENVRSDALANQHVDPNAAATESAPRGSKRGRSLWARSFHEVLHNKAAIGSLIVLAIMLVVSFVGPLLSPYTGDEIDLSIANHPPAPGALLGTDAFGRDVLTRLMLAGRISLTIGVASMVFSLVLGTLFGICAGYFGGWVDTIIMRVVDLIMSIPSLPLLIVLAAIMSEFHVAPDRRLFYIMIILSLVGWPSLARLIRGQVLSYRKQMFMQATEVLGLPVRSQLFTHLLPNVLPLLIVVATLSTASSILSESALSFLGLGVMPPAASWGNMINAANNLVDFRHHWWLWAPPGVAILITVAAINVLGDRLRDAFDPKSAR